ncbi:MAG: hypothetical protein ACRDKV_04590 [Solirubrobacterales bacterium]
MKKLAATVIGGVLLSAMPAVADQADRAASKTDEFLTIGGPKRLKARSTLRVPIRCSEGCDTKAWTKLKLPGTRIRPDTAKGHLGPGDSRKLVVKLNDAAAERIEKHPRASRLRVKVTAESSADGDRARVVKNFRFRAS